MSETAADKIGIATALATPSSSSVVLEGDKSKVQERPATAAPESTAADEAIEDEAFVDFLGATRQTNKHLQALDNADPDAAVESFSHLMKSATRYLDILDARTGAPDDLRALVLRQMMNSNPLRILESDIISKKITELKSSIDRDIRIMRSLDGHGNIKPLRQRASEKFAEFQEKEKQRFERSLQMASIFERFSQLPTIEESERKFARFQASLTRHFASIEGITSFATAASTTALKFDIHPNVFFGVNKEIFARAINFTEPSFDSINPIGPRIEDLAKKHANGLKVDFEPTPDEREVAEDIIRFLSDYALSVENIAAKVAKNIEKMTSENLQEKESISRIPKLIDNLASGAWNLALNTMRYLVAPAQTCGAEAPLRKAEPQQQKAAENPSRAPADKGKGMSALTAADSTAPQEAVSTNAPSSSSAVIRNEWGIKVLHSARPAATAAAETSTSKVRGRKDVEKIKAQLTKLLETAGQSIPEGKKYLTLLKEQRSAPAAVEHVMAQRAAHWREEATRIQTVVNRLPQSRDTQALRDSAQARSGELKAAAGALQEDLELNHYDRLKTYHAASGTDLEELRQKGHLLSVSRPTPLPSDVPNTLFDVVIQPTRTRDGKLPPSFHLHLYTSAPVTSEHLLEMRPLPPGFLVRSHIKPQEDAHLGRTAQRMARAAGREELLIHRCRVGTDFVRTFLDRALRDAAAQAPNQAEPSQRA